MKTAWVKNISRETGFYLVFNVEAASRRLSFELQRE